MLPKLKLKGPPKPRQKRWNLRALKRNQTFYEILKEHHMKLKGPPNPEQKMRNYVILRWLLIGSSIVSWLMVFHSKYRILRLNQEIAQEKDSHIDDLVVCRKNWTVCDQENAKLQHQIKHVRELLNNDKPWEAKKYLTIDMQDE